MALVIHIRNIALMYIQLTETFSSRHSELLVVLC